MKKMMKNVLIMVSLGLTILGCGKKEADQTLVKNLQTAFNGESNASAKYAKFAEKTDVAGHKTVAKFFKAASRAEAIHAESHGKILKNLGVEPVATIKNDETNLTVVEMLQVAIDGETDEFTNMYPDFIKHADSIGAKDAVQSFNTASEAEKVHAKIYLDAKNNLEKWAKNDKTFTVCEVCGWTVDGEAPDHCPECKVPKSKFLKF